MVTEVTRLMEMSDFFQITGVGMFTVTGPKSGGGTFLLIKLVAEVLQAVHS